MVQRLAEASEVVFATEQRLGRVQCCAMAGWDEGDAAAAACVIQGPDCADGTHRPHSTAMQICHRALMLCATASEARALVRQ